jgi:trimeric autotransporter adhesin
VKKNNLEHAMKNLKSQLLALLLCMICLLSAGYAQLTPSADAYTNTADPATNYGTKTLLDVESASQTAYIRFDLSSIPADYGSANISKATLKLYVNSVTTAGSFNVDYVTGTWAESTITADLAPALGTTIAASVPLTTADKNQYILIDITTAVQAWLSGTSNDGIALVGNSPVNATLDSKESTSTSHAAELDIVFAGGGGGGIAGIATANGSGLIGGGTGGTLNLSLTHTCAANQILQWSGSAWACASPTGSGTVTSVASGTGLTGGPITGSGTLSINTAVVPQLNAANTFTGNQMVSGTLSATGVVSGSSFQIAGTGPGLLFAFGSSTPRNAFFGFAGNTTMTGTGNLGVGALAFFSNTTGSNNTAIGDGALPYNTSGNLNTAVGLGALVGLESGSGNTEIGGRQSEAYFTGSNNTFVGVGSGAEGNGILNSTTVIGAGAIVGVSNNNYTNATAIGANAQVAADNAMVLGSINGVNGATASVNVGIGTRTPLATLDVAGFKVETFIGNPGCGANPFAGIAFGSAGFQSCGNYSMVGDGVNTYIAAPTGNIYFRTQNNALTAMTIDPSGDVNITGNLSASGTKNFRIDHPLDPANKYLLHAAIESSDVLNLYSGNVVLDASGEAVVQLPDWFEVINKDFRYQLTPIGAPGRDLYVAEEVSGGHFKIAGGKPGGKVSWQVSGVRNDAWEKAHPMEVEVDKGADRGHYLTPELVGAPETARIGYMAPAPGSERGVRDPATMPKPGNASPAQMRTPPRMAILPVPPVLHLTMPSGKLAVNQE